MSSIKSSGKSELAAQERETFHRWQEIHFKVNRFLRGMGSVPVALLQDQQNAKNAWLEAHGAYKSYIRNSRHGNGASGDSY